MRQFRGANLPITEAYVFAQSILDHSLLTNQQSIACMTINAQITWLFLLALPIACVAWTVTHEEVFREPREFCIKCSKRGKTLIGRKFFYLFTCEYCFSHYVTAVFLFLTHYKLLLGDWRGYIIAGFALVWIANFYMSLYGLLRQFITVEKAEAEILKDKIDDTPKK